MIFGYWSTICMSRDAPQILPPGSLEGWILVKTEDPKALYIHAAEWAEFLDWKSTPVFTDEEADTICTKI